jgi:NADH-quinone oxidoreductase subunit F
MDEGSVDLTVVDRVVAEVGRSPDATIPILQALQAEYRWLPEAALRRVCELTEITPANLVGVATFYDHFRFRPMGRHVLRVCHGTACHVKGAVPLQNAIEERLGIPAGEDTDPEGRTTVQKVACLGCCTLAPVVQSEHRTFGHLTPAGVPELLEAVERAAAEAEAARGEPGTVAVNGHGEIRVGLGSCCVVKGSLDLLHGLRDAVASAGLETAVRRVGCVGACHRTPIVEVVAPGREPRLYAEVTPDDAERIVRECFRPRGLVRRVKAAASRWIAPLVGGDVDAGGRAYRTDVREPQVAEFLGKQVHIATEHFGVLDPLDLDQAIELGAFRASRAVLEAGDRDAVIDTVERSGLRGRGGGGFPTGVKWEIARASDGDPKYVVVNCDEGDPGAYMDRSLMEGNPFGVLEGLMIGAYAIGSRTRATSTSARSTAWRWRISASPSTRARERGFLGKDILGSGFDFDVRSTGARGRSSAARRRRCSSSLEGQAAASRRRGPRTRP